MRNNNERPVCHRAEDLVTYLYGEANEVDAKDFAGHLPVCDACRKEFGVFQQVHESILDWRNEALGSGFNPAAVSIASTVDSTQFVRHERRLSAPAALREFFTVSPLWLRAATAFAALLLCALGVLTIARSWNKPAQVASKDNQTTYTPQQLDQKITEQVNKKLAQIKDRETLATTNNNQRLNQPPEPPNRLALNRVLPKTPRSRGLNRQEREQLAADLRLIPRDEDESPLAVWDEPNQ